MMMKKKIVRAVTMRMIDIMCSYNILNKRSNEAIASPNDCFAVYVQRMEFSYRDECLLLLFSRFSFDNLDLPPSEKRMSRRKPLVQLISPVL